MKKRILWLLMACLLVACSTPAVLQDAAESTAPTSSESYVPADEDTDSSWDSSAVEIDLGSPANSSGVTVTGATITISEAGTYLLSGTLEGQIVVEAGKDDLVRLVLNGVDITCADSAPIYCAKARKTVIILPEGTENTLRDGSSYSYADTEKEEPDAALFAKDDLSINGGGSLTVYASFNNGIGSKDNLVLASGNITVAAANHAIRGRDSLTVLGGSYSLTAGNDGIQSNNDTDDTVGWIKIEDGEFTINAAHDGIQAESSLQIEGGSFAITTGGGHSATATASDESNSYKGLKASSSIEITGGSFVIDSADDAVHANGDITIRGGDFTISTGDDGMHADDALLIEDGTIHILTSYEGLEGSTVTIRGGDIKLVASDDGINAAGGSDSGGGGFFGQDRFGGSGDYKIVIEGGSIEVWASGDGIDSNRDIEMSGGTLLVHGPTSGADAALDYDGSFTLTGGTIAAAGSSGMAQMPGTGSGQPSFMVYYSDTQAAGSEVTLYDASGTALLRFTPEKQFQTIVITTPELTEGETYTLTTGSALSTEITITSVVTTVSDSGAAVSGGFGGSGLPGGGGGSFGGRGQPPIDGEMPSMDNMPDIGDMPDLDELPNRGEIPNMDEMPPGEAGRNGNAPDKPA